LVLEHAPEDDGHQRKAELDPGCAGSGLALEGALFYRVGFAEGLLIYTS
jgi:hypothetical protein